MHTSASDTALLSSKSNELEGKSNTNLLNSS